MSVTTSPHSLHPVAFMKPSGCQACGAYVLGFGVALKCETCGKVSHRKCHSKLPNNCTAQAAAGVDTNSWSCRPGWAEEIYASREKMEHAFEDHNYKVPTMCQHCEKMLFGVYNQGGRCKVCNLPQEAE